MNAKNADMKEKKNRRMFIVITISAEGIRLERNTIRNSYTEIL